MGCLFNVDGSDHVRSRSLNPSIRRHERRFRVRHVNRICIVRTGGRKEIRDGDRAPDASSASWRNSSGPARRRGPQCFGSYFDEKGGSCALGAVYEGVYHLPRQHGKLIPDHLERLFRCLDEMTKKCPQGCSKRLPLASMIVHLNDDHRLSREQIAEWLTQESSG